MMTEQSHAVALYQIARAGTSRMFHVKHQDKRANIRETMAFASAQPSPVKKPTQNQTPMS